VTAFWKDRRVLYRAYDADGRLLYIGRTSNLERRVAEHRTDKWWWRPLVVKIRAELSPSEVDAKATELAAIKAEEPVFNQMGFSDWSSTSRWSLADHALHASWRASHGFRRAS